MAKKKLAVFPYNGNGLEALDCINWDEYEFLGFVDDDPFKQSESYPLHSRAILEQYPELFVLAVPGSAASFRNRQELIASLGISRFITAIHPRASLGRSVQVGENCLIMAGVVLTSNTKIGDHVCILPNSVIHHDTVLHDYTLVGSNVVIAGYVTVGRNCYIGSGTNIMNGLTIGDASLIGLGSNVIRDVPRHSKVVGNPARDIDAIAVF